MRYTWNETKNRRNLKVHGVGFEDAVRVFQGPTLERVDDRYDYAEERIYAIGVVNGLELRSFTRTTMQMSAELSRRGVRSRMRDASTGKALRG
jgi:uncharacterized DUF497 family protein